MRDTALIWFRNDLRVNDNEALRQAAANADKILPLYVFDERIFKGQTKFGFPKTGAFRCQFIIESVLDLRENLKALGLHLMIRVGKPEEEIFEVAKHVKASWVYANRERTQEEVDVQDALERNIWSLGLEMVYTRGKMLYYTSDLPFPIAQTPDNFTSFRKEVEKFVPVREPLAVPQSLDGKMADCNLPWGEVPTMEDFGHKMISSPRFKGGETAGLQELKYYLWDTDLVAKYKETRNELLGRDFSTKLSPYLAHGCISPKTIYHEIKLYEEQRTANESTYWVIFELMWRDYFRLVGKKYENKIFQKTGIFGKAKDVGKVDYDLFKLWAEGRTGIPFIDANMKELNATGFMSNRGRQNVASFLTKDLKINWQMGAHYFESQLIDYDPCSNYGNWCYIAGIGNDPRENRYFNILSQAMRYDEQGNFVKKWIPALERLSSPYFHRPDLLNRSLQEKYDFVLGRDYPKAIIPTSKWS